jgi:hypothetical protein
LRDGAVPMDVLTAKIERWIRSKVPGGESGEKSKQAGG